MKYLKLIKNTFEGFMNDNAFKLSASLSYYTLFSLAPMILIFLSVVGFFYGQDAIKGQLYGQIDGLIGKEAALQVQQMVQKVELSGKTGFAGIVGFVMLFVGATGVFAEIQDSINQIWSLRAKPKNGILKYLTNRFLSFSLIVSLGFLFIVSLLVNTLLEAFSQRLALLFTESTVHLFTIVNLGVIWVVMTLLFAIIFKVLPDGRVANKDALMGAGVTALLFMIGKYLIGFYLGQSNISDIYGAAGSIVILLTWVYYSSLILFFGAEFTKIYAFEYGEGIKPASYTVLIKQTEVQSTQKNVENIVK
ncbi:YihY/virulence factor BrkB family protein [Emticicia sp. W12TSBA100-4]|uniref:YihY/virulence factor BrkB family protein n=1 Tax=Emticicia sp. W12TSBA100-4 TaxID=3160965 RepID=UPI00330565F0